MNYIKRINNFITKRLLRYYYDKCKESDLDHSHYLDKNEYASNKVMEFYIKFPSKIRKKLKIDREIRRITWNAVYYNINY